MVLTGLIRDIFPEETWGNFRKTSIWLTEMFAETNPMVWEINFWNDDKSMLRNYKTGDKVNVNIAIIGRLKTKNGQEVVYTTLRGLKIEKLK